MVLVKSSSEHEKSLLEKSFSEVIDSAIPISMDDMYVGSDFISPLTRQMAALIALSSKGSPSVISGLSLRLMTRRPFHLSTDRMHPTQYNQLLIRTAWPKAFRPIKPKSPGGREIHVAELAQSTTHLLAEMDSPSLKLTRDSLVV